MPWGIRRSERCSSEKPYEVYNKENGRHVGCHASREAAAKQIAALNANVEEASVPVRRDTRSIVHVKDVEMNTDQVIHDWLLEHKPEAANHDADECSICKRETASKQEEGVTAEQKIFTQEQHEQLLASAVEKAATEATAKVDAEVLRLNEQLEEAQKALTQRDEEITTLKSEIESRDEAARLAEVASERTKLVRAVANFSDEQVAERRDRWAKMSEEDFNAYLEDIRSVAKETPGEEEVPPTNFDGTRETAGDKGTEKSVVADFFSSGASTVAATL